MFPIKRIVVATDMSPFAARAEARAAMLAHELGSESLDLLHVIDNLALESWRNLTHPLLDTERQLMESARKQMAKAEHRLSVSYGIPITTITLNVGRTHDEITRYANILNAGLVVLGAYGGGFIRELFIGSTVDKVLQVLTRPLLIVKQEPRVSYRQVLIAVDFSQSARQTIAYVTDIAPHANITVLHVFEVPFESALHFAGVSNQQIQLYRAEMQAQKNSEMQRLLSEFEIAGKSLSYTVESGSTLAVILEKAEVLKPDLIVVGKHGLSEKEGALPGGVTKHVLQGTNCDVLVVDGVS